MKHPCLEGKFSILETRVLGPSILEMIEAPSHLRHPCSFPERGIPFIRKT